LGRVAAYDAATVSGGNVKATASVTITPAAINALLVAGDGITVTAPAALTVTSGQVVSVGGGVTGNTVTGGTVTFTAEPLFFTQGPNTTQQINLNGATSGQFTLTLVLNPSTAPAPVTGTTQAT